MPLEVAVVEKELDAELLRLDVLEVVLMNVLDVLVDAVVIALLTRTQLFKIRFPPWNPSTTHRAVNGVRPTGTCSATDWFVQFQIIIPPPDWNLQPEEPLTP